MPQITYPNKVLGDQFFAEEATEIKDVVNAIDVLVSALQTGKVDAATLTAALAGKVAKAGDTMTGILNITKAAAADNPHMLFVNPNIVGNPIYNNEQRAESLLGADGILYFRNLAGKGVVFLNSSNVSPLFRIYENGNVEALGKELAYKDLGINTQIASYTLALSDRGAMVRMNVASANTCTVPPNSAVAFPVGTQIVITQAGAGQTTIVAGSGVTINASGGKMKLTGQWSGASLIQVSLNNWTLLGDTAA